MPEPWMGTYISVGGLLIRDDLSVLLQLRDEKPAILYPGYWAIPAGRLEPAESLEAGAVRELAEETGYRMAHPKPLPSLEGVFPDGQQVIRYVFWDVYDSDQAIRVLEGRAMEFIPVAAVASLKLVPGNDLIIASCVAAYEQLRERGNA